MQQIFHSRNTATLELLNIACIYVSWAASFVVAALFWPYMHPNVCAVLFTCLFWSLLIPLQTLNCIL